MLAFLFALLLAPAPAAAQKTENVAHQQFLGLVADPANVVKGSTFYRSDLDTFRVRAGDFELWDGTVWFPLPRATNGLFSRLNSIRIVEPTLWPGGTVTADIDAAITDCASSVCLVLYPSNLGAGEATSIPENVAILDLRKLVTLDSALSTYVHPALLLRQRFTQPEAQTFEHQVGLFLRTEADDGGRYESASKDMYAPLKLAHFGRTRGEHHLIRGNVFGYGIGDALFLGGAVWGYGGKNVTGTSQPAAQFAEINVKQGATVFTATVSGDPASGATVITYTGDANESVLGERALINTTRTTTTGTVSSISTDTVTFAGAPDWTLLVPSPIGQYFKVNADDVTLGGVSTGHWYRVIARTATTLQLETTYDSDLTTSGAYTLAQGAEIQSFDTTANTLTIEANSYDWGAADNLISPPMPALNFRGLNMFFTKEFKTGTSRGIDLMNLGPFAWDQGILIEGAPAGDNAYKDGISIAAKVDDAIDLSSATIATSAIRFSNGDKLRWGSDASPSDFYFTTSGTTFFMTKALRVEGSSASVTPLIVKQTQASPSVQFFRVIDSANATILESDSTGIVNIKPAFGVGITLDPTSTATFRAAGGNTNVPLDLITKGTGAVRVNAQNSTGTGGFAVYDGAATPKLMFSVTNAGVGNNGAAFKHGRVSTGSVGAGGAAAVTLTWTTAFADANYTVTCSLAEATASTSTLRLHHLESVAAGSVVVRVVNDDGANPKTGTLHCTAVHD